MYYSASFISINTTFLRCILVVCSSFIFSVVQHSVVWTHYNLILPVDILIVWSLFFSSSNAAMNSICVLVQCTKVSLGYTCLRMEFHGYRICACLTLSGSTNLFSKTLLTNHTPAYSACNLLFVYILINT